MAGFFGHISTKTTTMTHWVGNNSNVVYPLRTFRAFLLPCFWGTAVAVRNARYSQLSSLAKRTVTGSRQRANSESIAKRSDALRNGQWYQKADISFLFFVSFQWFTAIPVYVNNAAAAAVQPLSLVEFSFVPIPFLSRRKQFSRNARKRRISRPFPALSISQEAILYWIP